MDAFLLYLIKMMVCSAVMYAYYLWFLKDKTFHHYNRFYLLLTVFISFSLPLLKLSYFTIDINPKLMFLIQNLQESQTTSTEHGFHIYQIFYAIVGLVSILFLAKLLLGLLRINHIKKSFPHEELQGIKFYQTNLEEAPFSFFRNLFWKNSIQMESAVGRQILKHEMVHIEQKHTWDKLFMQIAKSIFWMNPLFYIINREINLIHEYLADNKAVKRSDTKAFAQMLLESHFPGTTIPATSPFLSSNLKKRLKMLTKSKTKYSYARRIFALPLLFMLSFAYLVNAKNNEIKTTNLQIDKAVDQIKKDTAIVVETNILPDKVNQAHDGLRETTKQISKDNQMIADINKKIADKNKAINELIKNKKTDTQEFVDKEKEIDFLNLQADNIINSERYQNLLKQSDEYGKQIDDFYNSAEWINKVAAIEKNAAEMEAKYNSPEWKKKVAIMEKRAAEMEAKYNSPEWKKKVAAMEKRASEIEKRVNSSEFKKKIEEAKKSGNNVYFFNDANLAKAFELKDINFDDFKFNNEEVKKLLKDLPTFELKDINFGDVAFGREMTPKEKRQYEKRKKEVKELQKKLNEKRKELGANNLIVDRPWIVSNAKAMTIPRFNNGISINKNDSKFEINGSDFRNYTSGDMKFFINGKEVSKSEMDKISPKDIKSVNVNKYNDKGEIKIETK